MAPAHCQPRREKAGPGPCLTHCWFGLFTPVVLWVPRQELLGFYRQKIAEFDGEHADMLNKLDRYKTTFEDQVRAADTLLFVYTQQHSFFCFTLSSF